MKGLWLVVLSLPAVAVANPIVVPSPRPPGPGVIRVVGPEAAARWSENHRPVAPSPPSEERDRWRDDAPFAPKHPCRPYAGTGDSTVRSSDLVRFADELLRIYLLPDTARITGFYRLDCPGGGPFRMTFPLPACRGQSLDAVVCFDPAGARNPLEVTRTDSAWSWTVPDRGPGRYEIDLTYDQRLVAGICHYVLSTTRSWPEPIGHVAIEVSAPSDGCLLSNYRLRSTPAEGRWTYDLDASEFVTDRDLLVSWQPLSGEPGAVSGIVRTKRGKPVAYATVLLEGEKKGALSDGNGRFTIPGVSPGAHVLRAQAIGMSFARSPVLVIPGETSEAEVTLDEGG